MTASMVRVTNPATPGGECSPTPRPRAEDQGDQGSARDHRAGLEGGEGLGGGRARGGAAQAESC